MGTGSVELEDLVLRTGLIGRSISGSRSPWLHEQEARAQGLDLTYELFDFTERNLPDEALGSLLDELGRAGYRGVNVTYPFKQAVIPMLDGVAESAALVGAVNTIAMRDGRLIGHNTDSDGFRDSLRDGLPGASLEHVLQLGAGGAGAAVACALLNLGVRRLQITDIDTARAHALAAHLGERFHAQRVEAVAASDIDTRDTTGIVNATPVGMADHPGIPLDPDLLKADQWVVDIVYFPLETRLLRLARERGCRVLNGSGMVVGQAALAFEIITGHRADGARMRQSFFS